MTQGRLHIHMTSHHGLHECAQTSFGFPLCTIINSCFKCGYFPDIWKCAEIVPIEKKKSVDTESDFRPISLLWHLGKIIEKAVMHFYVQFVLPTIDGNQYAYQKGRGTVDAIIAAIDNWTQLLDEPKSKYLTVAFLDMSKAFDKMDRGKLIDMLTRKGINYNLVQIINSFLTHRYQSVRIGNNTSRTLPVINGTPQGTLLGPVFWLLYVDSLEVECDIIKYADDLTLTGLPAKTLNQQLDLQTSLDTVSTWCNEYNMVANAKKSSIMHLTNKHARYQFQPPTLKQNGEQIPPTTKTRFLGITIDQHLFFEDHVDSILKNVRMLTYTLVNLKRSGVPQRLLTRFYLTCIRPRMTYGSVAWFCMMTDQQKKRVIQLEKLSLKIIAPGCDKYSERTALLNIIPLDEYIDSMCHQHIDKIKTPGHCLHHLLPQPSARRPSRHTTRLNTSSRTELRGNTLLMCYSNAGCVNYKV